MLMQRKGHVEKLRPRDLYRDTAPELSGNGKFDVCTKNVVGDQFE